MRRREPGGRPAVALAAAIALTTGSVCSAAGATPGVRCHVDYGGEVRQIVARPLASPLAVAPIEIGSYFRFRLVVLRAQGLPDEVRIETFSDRDDGPVLIHQGRYTAPFAVSGSRRTGGFTGHQTVYEPVRDGELQYWCERADVR
jgi:hypothetical protein